ncbi:MAG TPA: endo-1,4-beta-xylanase [Bacteroidetes bacterium]|nr:endo-1,4-beta-xylanase [Bacteroidota bacterium]
MKIQLINNLVKPIAGFIAFMLLLNSCSRPEPGLKDKFTDHFLIGAALNTNQIMAIDSAALPFVIRHFNSITAENAMKWERIHPRPGEYNFTVPDSLVAFGERNGMFIVGHCLLWHQQTPDWVFEDSLGNPLDREALLEVLKNHIFTVMDRYKGKVHGWDVVNEAVDEDGQMRRTKWYEIIGEDYVQKAFEFAREADPRAELYYNDYNIEQPGKREGAVKLLQSLIKNGVKIDGVGIQGHWHLNSPSLEVIDSSLTIFSSLGLKVHITELDIDVLPSPYEGMGADISHTAEFMQAMNPWPESLPDSMQQALAQRYADIFNIFLKHHAVLDRVTFWGLHDGYSWKNNWPVRGRTNYPLLFDRNYQPKPAYDAVMETAVN